MAARQPIAVEVRPALDPEGQPAVLLQFTQGWMVVSPANARRVAGMLLDCADEVEEADAPTRRPDRDA